MIVNVTMDKIVIEFESVPASRYLRWSMVLQLKRLAKPVVYNKLKLYCYQLNVKLGEEVYMHVFYKNFAETQGYRHTLRIETNPVYLSTLRDLLKPMWEVAEQVNFISGDVAFDVTEPLDKVLIMANDRRRRIRLYKDTRYFGRPHQRKLNAYCRTYDKASQLASRGIYLDHDLTRIEMVYKPQDKIRLEQVTAYPPEFNKYYYASVLTDLGALTVKERERVHKLQLGEEVYTQHVRKTIKKSLASQYELNFNRLASEHWTDMINEYKLMG